MSTLERAYFLARSGEVADLAQLKTRLKIEGCRAVDALLATYSVRRHLQAICAATFHPPEPTDTPPEAAEAAQHDESST
ncbi:hypothetical protein [Phenylobacterium sp.]|uniref:hypothetical protein n=1 Tax=Phenylobacterium sp. TaxID=1871053 RepID=UPI00272F517C|nr:hypothetical protein [Phenylobacterium sp.]MDP1875202.1 hypothetical protein [Phenylobacterium sp.]MDP3488888.1 hypothetical protein [Phenylobacterium sp.]